ncbi:lipopolysaccharide assembly protein LapB, partial [Variovorax sp. J22R115]|uniref:tetratricopeptide repeat protein n=1 Tax=Variovorax sp. J22R115 TaxID=3053509 RepID=UPI002577181A
LHDHFDGIRIPIRTHSPTPIFKDKRWTESCHSRGQLRVEALVAPEETNKLELVQVAELLAEQGVFDRAAELYARAITTVGGNPLTYGYLNSLIESNQRSRAQQLVDQLPEPVRTRSDFRRLEANLARRKGDWRHTAELLRIELNEFPKNSTVAVNYVGALHRLDSRDEAIQQYLASKPVFDGQHPVAEAEIAKYEVAHGLRPQAIRRLYSLVRGNPRNTRLAGYFLAQLLIGELLPEMANEIQKAGLGVVAVLTAGGEDLVVAVDFEAELVGGWTGMVGANSEVAKAVEGKGVGDVVSLHRGLGQIDYRVTNLYSVYGFAMQQAELLLRSTANHEGPAWSVNIAAPNGGLDVETLARPAREKEARVTAAYQGYKDMRFPLSTLAKHIGTSPLELVLGWRVDLATMFVALGTEDEQDAHWQLLKERPAVVLDLPTLGELVALKVFRQIAPLWGRPLVPSAARDELMGILEADLQLEPEMALQEVNGQIARVAYTESWRQSRLSVLREMLASIDELCEVTPVLGPKVLGPGHRWLELLLDDATLDAVYLAVERNAVLVTDDAALRLEMARIDCNRSVSAQAVLAYARAAGAVSEDQYVSALGSKLLRAQDFVSVSGADFIREARRTPHEASEVVLAGLGTLRSPNLNIATGVKVVAEMLTALAGELKNSVLARYYSATLDAFRVHQVPRLLDVVHRALAGAMAERLEQLPRRKATLLRRELGALMTPPAEVEPEALQLTPIAFAIRELLFGMTRRS